MKKSFLRLMACLMMAVMIGTCMGNATGVFAEDAEAKHTDSVTVKEAASWWYSVAIPVEKLLGDVKPEEVDHIDFTGTDVFIIQYHNTTGDSQDNKDSEYYDPYTNQTLNAKSQTAKNIDFGESYLFNICFSQATDIDCTVTWKVYTEAAAVTENAAEVIDVKTKVNESWGVYTDTIPAGTLQKYADGVTMTLEFTVNDGCSYAMVTAADAGNGWSKMVDYITGAEFNSDDGGFIVFGATDKTVTMTLNTEGVKQIIDHGQGLLFQGFQIDVTKVTLTPVAAEPTAAPAPTATPAEEPKEEPAASETPAEEPKEEPVAGETPAEEPKEEPVAGETPAEEPKEEPVAGETPAEEPKEEPVAGETPAEESKKEAVEVTGTEYVVEAGDTLGEIAAAAGISVQELAQANQISNVDLIRKGAVLVIPTVDKTTRHLVVKGDTLSEIAKTYGYKLADLVSANNIANPDLIVIGQVIVLP